MNEWKTVRLGDVCEILNGYAFKSDKYVDSGIRVIRITNVQKGFIEDNSPAFYPITEKDTLKDYELHENDLLISLTGNVGRVALLSKEMLPAALNQRVGCIRIRDKNLLISYLFTFLNSDKFESDCIYSARGIAQKNMSTEWLKNYFIPLPPIEVQIKIANNLNTCAKIIKKHNKQLNNFDLLIKSRFIEMFGNPQCISNNWKVNPLSDYCIVNPKKSELGPIPDDYELSFIPMQSVSENGDVDTSSIKHYKDVKTGFTYFRENDVLFAKITPCMENGKGGVARKLKNQIGFGSTEFHVLRPIETISNSEWIYRLTTFKTFRKDAENNMTGSAGQRRTPKEFFDKYKVGLPPIELQNDFATFVQQIDKSKFAVQKSLEKTEILYKSLMQRYFA